MYETWYQGFLLKVNSFNVHCCPDNKKTYSRLYIYDTHIYKGFQVHNTSKVQIKVYNFIFSTVINCMLFTTTGMNNIVCIPICIYIYNMYKCIYLCDKLKKRKRKQKLTLTFTKHWLLVLAYPACNTNYWHQPAVQQTIGFCGLHWWPKVLQKQFLLF